MTASGALVRGLLLGLGAAVPIGPVNVEIARRTLRSGFPAGVALGCGACTVDMLYALAVSLGVGDRLAHSRNLSAALGMAGAALLAYLGYGCFRGAYAAFKGRRSPGVDQPPVAPVPDPSALFRTYGQGVLMTATNPMTLAFWFVAIPGVVGPAASAGELAWTCAGVGLGALGWVIAFGATLSLLGRWRRDTWVVVADVIGGVILWGFAAVAAWRVIRP